MLSEINVKVSITRFSYPNFFRQYPRLSVKGWLSMLKVRPIVMNFDCKGILFVLDSPIENHRTPIKSKQCVKSKQCEINVYPQYIAFDCAHIPHDCNDIAIQTAENKKSRLSMLLRQESGLNHAGIQICSYQNISSTII